MTTVAVLVILILCIVRTHCEQCAERPPPRDKEDMCCRLNLSDQQIECMESIHEQWRLFSQLHDKGSFVKTQDMCFSNCIFNNTNIINSDNKVNSVELKNVMGKILATDWSAESAKIMEICTELVDNAKSHGPRESSMVTDTLLSNCNMAAELLFMCFQQQIITACPDSLWNNVSECNNLRAYFKSCPFEKRGHYKHQPSK